MNHHLDLQKDHQLLDNVDFIKQSWRFVPKHLIALRNQQIKGSAHGLQRKFKDKDATYQQTSLEIINKNKNLYLAPVRDLQQIMKHFKRKFQDIPMNDIKNQIKSKRGKKNNGFKRLKTSLDLRDGNPQQLIENKITKLLQLPTIKRANSEAQKIKMLNMQQSTKKSFQKQQILRKFEQYFSKQIDLIHKQQFIPSSKLISETQFRKLRAKTTID